MNYIIYKLYIHSLKKPLKCPPMSLLQICVLQLSVRADNIVFVQHSNNISRFDSTSSDGSFAALVCTPLLSPRSPIPAILSPCLHCSSDPSTGGRGSWAGRSSISESLTGPDPSLNCPRSLVRTVFCLSPDQTLLPFYFLQSEIHTA